MKQIYIKDSQGNKIAVNVTDEVEKVYFESIKEEWRNNAYENYHTTSLERITEAGHDFADENADVEKMFLEKEAQVEKQKYITELRIGYAHLTELQKDTLDKLFGRNMSQAEIARDEGISEQAVSDRIERIYARLRKFIKKN